MLAGHFALAAVVKSRQPQVPLWALMLSTQLLDVLFVGLYLAGIEKLRSVDGGQAGYGELIITADYTHSLVGALAISFVAALVTVVVWGRRNGIIIGAMVFSHWILDFIVHRPDLALLPVNSGEPARYGLGLWQWPLLTAAIELGMILVGAFLYYHAAMRTAIKAERVEAKAGNTQTRFRNQAMVASVVLFVSLVGTLLADFFVVN
jgi:hypothetical protein